MKKLIMMQKGFCVKHQIQYSLSLGKKFTIAAGISAATVAGYTSINFDRQTSFNDRTKAEKELEKDGIPSDQKYSAYKPGISELIYRSITPFGYQDDIDENGLMPNLFEKIKELGLPNAGMSQDILANIRFGRVERIETLNDIYEQEIQELLAMDDRREDQISNINEKYQKLAHDQAYSSILKQNERTTSDHGNS